MGKNPNQYYNTTIELANTLQQPTAASRIQRLRQYFISQEVFATLQPLFLFTYIYGLTPFRIVKRRNGTSEIRASCFGFCNTAAYVILYGVCFLNSLLNAESVVGYFFRTNISIVGDTLQICNGIVTGIVIYTTALTQRCKMRRIIEVFNELDFNFANIGVRVKYSRIYRYALLLIVAKILIIAIYCGGVYLLLRSVHVNPSICVCIAFLLQHSVLFLAICLFCFIARGFERRLVILNKVLKNLTHQWDNSIVKPMPKQRSLQCLDSFSMYTIVTNNPCEIIQESMEIHHMICDAASTANKYFTYQLLTIISIAFLIIVFDAYYVLETLLGKSAHESKFKTVEFVTFFSCQMILYLIAIISIVEGSNRAIKKSEKTGGIVHSLLNKAKNAELKEKLQQFSLQLLHLKIHFTAAGLFNIDRTLYFTISGALTTYLIILLQFTSNNEPEQQSIPMGQNGTTPLLNLVSNITANA